MGPQYAGHKASNDGSNDQQVYFSIFSHSAHHWNKTQLIGYCTNNYYCDGPCRGSTMASVTGCYRYIAKEESREANGVGVQEQ